MEFADRNTVDQMNAERDGSVQEELVVAENGNVSWINSEGEKEVLAENKSLLTALTSDDERIYVATGSGSIHPIGTENHNYDAVLPSTDSRLNAIEFYDEDLLAAYGEEIFNVDADEKVAEREYAVNALETHGGRLIDGTNGGEIFRTLEDEQIAESTFTVAAMASTGNLLHGGEDSLESEWYVCSSNPDDSESEKRITERDMVTAMAEVDGDTYDAASDVVYRNFDEEFYRIEDTPAGVDIYDMAAVSREVVENLRGDVK